MLYRTMNVMFQTTKRSSVKSVELTGIARCTIVAIMNLSVFNVLLAAMLRVCTVGVGISIMFVLFPVVDKVVLSMRQFTNVPTITHELLPAFTAVKLAVGIKVGDPIGDEIGVGIVGSTGFVPDVELGT